MWQSDNCRASTELNMKFRIAKHILLGFLTIIPYAVAETPSTGHEAKKAVVVEEGTNSPEAGGTKKEVAKTKDQPASKALVLPKDRDEAVRLQIFLDQKFYGPGFIDGKPGTFTKLAIENYNTGMGREKNDMRVIQESVTEIENIYATAIIPSFVSEYVDPQLPTKRSLQAKKKYMAYRSVTEFMAERYHTSEDLLIELNGASTMRNASSRKAIKVPNIVPFKIEDLKTGRSHKLEINLTARHVVVDTNTKQVYIYQLILPSEDEQEGAVRVNTTRPKLVASFPITPGQSRFIPKGIWNLKNSVELPVWRYDKKLLETGVRGKEALIIPPGPNNPVGIIWNGLTKSGIGIHGTNNPRTIGRARSAGCIRLSNWDAARFPTLVRPGAVVKVQ